MKNFPDLKLNIVNERFTIKRSPTAFNVYMYMYNTYEYKTLNDFNSVQGSIIP